MEEVTIDNDDIKAFVDPAVKPEEFMLLSMFASMSCFLLKDEVKANNVGEAMKLASSALLSSLRSIRELGISFGNNPNKPPCPHAEGNQSNAQVEAQLAEVRKYEAEQRAYMEEQKRTLREEEAKTFARIEDLNKIISQQEARLAELKKETGSE